jgi:hypothetical protein
MFLKHITTGKMVEVLSLRDLFNPVQGSVIGRYYYGEQAQEDPESFDKGDLAFCSDEPIPKCWTDPGYREDEHLRQPKPPG